jgi:hypothetical protein
MDEVAAKDQRVALRLEQAEVQRTLGAGHRVGERETYAHEFVEPEPSAQRGRHGQQFDRSVAGATQVVEDRVVKF